MEDEPALIVDLELEVPLPDLETSSFRESLRRLKLWSQNTQVSRRGFLYNTPRVIEEMLKSVDMRISGDSVADIEVDPDPQF